VAEPEATKLERLLSRIGTAIPIAIPAACAKVRHRGSSCRRCLDVCPAGAIHVGDTLTVDPDRCVSCGFCAAVCRTGALAFRRGHVQLLMEAQALALTRGGVTFACPRYRKDAPRSAVVRVLCLAALDDAVLLGSVARGAGSVHLLDAPCHDCPLGSVASEAAATTVESCNSLLLALGRPERISFVDEAPMRPTGGRISSGGTSRRAFLSLARREAITTLAGAMLPVEPSEGPKEWIDRHGLPAKHMLLVDALRRLSRSGPHELPKEVAVPLVRPGISDSCTGCGMCSTFCPTGALKSTAYEDGTVEIALEREKCTGCDLCADICYQDAININGSRDVHLDGAEPEVLWRGRPPDGNKLIREWAKEQLMGG
jgi:ferredoxin